MFEFIFYGFIAAMLIKFLYNRLKGNQKICAVCDLKYDKQRNCCPKCGENNPIFIKYSISNMFLEFYQRHRYVLIFTVFLALLGFWQFIGGIIGQILGIGRCLLNITNDEIIIGGFGLCSLLDWIL